MSSKTVGLVLVSTFIIIVLTSQQSVEKTQANDLVENKVLFVKKVDSIKDDLQSESTPMLDSLIYCRKQLDSLKTKSKVRLKLLKKERANLLRQVEEIDILRYNLVNNY